MPHTYDYPRPSVTVDCVVFGLDADADLKVMLIERDVDPFASRWALPGGFGDRHPQGLPRAALHVRCRRP
jgi:8-oxo-dGTP diphosphatase